jgi:hypothetical protein
MVKEMRGLALFIQDIRNCTCAAFPPACLSSLPPAPSSVPTANCVCTSYLSSHRNMHSPSPSHTPFPTPSPVLLLSRFLLSGWSVIIACWCAGALLLVQTLQYVAVQMVPPRVCVPISCCTRIVLARSLLPPLLGMPQRPLAPLVVIACTALVGNLSFITLCMLRRTLLGLAGTVPHNTIPPVLALRSHCPHLRQMLSVLTCPLACLTVLDPAGKSVEAEQKRINKEMANIRQKFGAFHSHFASCRGCTVWSGAHRLSALQSDKHVRSAASEVTENCVRLQAGVGTDTR